MAHVPTEKGEPMEIHRCGNSWVCCDGECENCLANNMTTSNRTEERRTDGNG